MFFLNKNIRAVIFDLDNTLYNENMYIAEVLHIFSKKYGLDFNKNDFIDNENLREKSNDIFSFWLHNINFYSKQKQEELFALYQNISFSMPLYEDARELLVFLKRQRVKIAILTNGVVSVQENKIKCIKELKKYKPRIFYARSLGKDYEKPHEKSFKMVLDSLNEDIENVIFIGDNLLTDIVGAERVGIKAIWVNRNDSKNIANVEFAVTNLREVLVKCW
ncbi:HAD family hydrolase [Campylobacter lari]|nr:HAD family hydrolase [Campylobacter lari]